MGSGSASPRMLTVRADALKMPDGTPLKNIEKHRAQDVLCGRGGGTNHHVGNAHWRKLVNSNKRLYLSLPKKQKALVAKSIVHAVRAQNPPGRFLARDPSNSLWCDIGDQKATEKTSQALREGAPDIRTEMAKEGRMEKGNIMGGQMSKKGLIGVDQTKLDGLIALTAKSAAPSAPAAMSTSTSNPLASSSQGGVSSLNGQSGDASMVMAFQQYLGGKNPNTQTAAQSLAQSATSQSLAQSAATQSAAAVPASTMSTGPASSQIPPVQQRPLHLLGPLASRKLLQSDLGRDMPYPLTAMSRKLSGHSTNGPALESVLDNQFMKANLNAANGPLISYNELTQRAADRSPTARAGLQMASQAAPVTGHQPGQILPNLYNDVAWNVATGVPHERPQLMTDLLRSSSLSSASGVGRTNYLGSNNFTNSMLGNTASMGTGGSFMPRTEPSTLARLLQQQKALQNNPLRGNAMNRLDPTSLYSMSSLGRLPQPSLQSQSSFGGQLSHPAPPSDFGQYMASNRTGGLTSLHPSVSSVMAQMKFEQLMKKNMAEASYQHSLATQDPNLNAAPIQQLSLPREEADISIPTTSAPKRGVFSSLDDLCRAAGLNELQPGRTHSELAKELYKNDEGEVSDLNNRVKTKKRPSNKGEKNAKTAMPKLGVNDSSLVDDDSDDDAVNYLSAKRKRDESNHSVKEHSKRSKIKTKGGEDLELDRFAQKTEGLRDTDLLSRGVSLNRIASVNFSQKIKNLPLSEASLDRGHSLAMSEISLDRGQSLVGNVFMGCDDGQFDDASEDDQAQYASKKVTRGYTVGTINTFPLDM